MASHLAPYIWHPAAPTPIDQTAPETRYMGYWRPTKGAYDNTMQHSSQGEAWPWWWNHILPGAHSHQWTSTSWRGELLQDFFVCNQDAHSACRTGKCHYLGLGDRPCWRQQCILKCNSQRNDLHEGATRSLQTRGRRQSVPPHKRPLWAEAGRLRLVPGDEPGPNEGSQIHLLYCWPLCVLLVILRWAHHHHGCDQQYGGNIKTPWGHSQIQGGNQEVLGDHRQWPHLMVPWFSDWAQLLCMNHIDQSECIHSRDCW